MPFALLPFPVCQKENHNKLVMFFILVISTFFLFMVLRTISPRLSRLKGIKPKTKEAELRN